MSVEQTIKCRNIKAYPSINSPNDGDFHAEQNTKQFIKSITTKPFIIGETTQDVSKSFNYVSRDTDNPNDIVMTNGMFSIGGYVFKISKDDADNFDKAVASDDLTTIDSRPLKDYVLSMTNYGVSNELTINPNDFLLDEYNPELYWTNSTTVAELMNNLETAFINGTRVGYIPFVHSGNFFNRLEIGRATPESAPSYIKYQDNKINIKWYNQTTITPTSTAEYINSNLMEYNRNIANAVVPSESSVLVVYPIFVKKRKFTDKEKTPQTVYQFTDIFNTTYSFTRTDVRTKPYPYTQNTLTDMGNNEPLSSVLFSDCSLTTLPNNIYDFTTLYYDEMERATDIYIPQGFLDDFVIPVPTTGGKTILDIIDDSTSEPLFTKVKLADVYKNVPQSIDSFSTDNDLTYYCLTNVPDNLKYSFQDKEGNDVKVPVAFMASNGELCVNGFIGTGNDNSFPVESYVHFIKRLYVADPSNSIENPNEVTLSQLVDWAGITDAYNTYLARPVSAYMHICYSSLMEKVIYASDNSTAFKSSGCGSALSGVSGVTTDDYSSSFPYDHKQYTSTGLAVGNTDISTDMIYPKDRTSDRHKVSNIHNLFDFIEADSDSAISGFSYTKLVNPTYLPIDIEDPVYFCIYGAKKGYGNSINDIDLYKLTVSAGNVVTEKCDVTFGYSTVAIDEGSILYLSIDDTLMPSFSVEPDIDYMLHPTDETLVPYVYFDANMIKYNDSVIPSLAHGVSLGIPTYGWAFSIKNYAKIQLDSHGYLKGQNFDFPDDYIGLKISPDFIGDDSLALSTTATTSLATNMAYGIETLYTATDESALSVRERESSIHTSKIYGDGYKSIEDLIAEAVSDGGIDPDLIASINNRITKIENIIEYPYDIDDGTISGRLRLIEEAIGMPYTEELNISTRLTNLENSLTEKYEELKDMIGKTQCVWLVICINGATDRTVLLGNNKLVIGVGTGSGPYSGNDEIPPNTTMIVTIPMLVGSDVIGIGSLSDIAMEQMMLLNNESNPQRPSNVSSVNNINRWYTMQARNRGDWLIKMYIQNNRTTSYNYDGFYAIKLCGDYASKPSSSEQLLSSDNISIEFVANDQLPDIEPHYTPSDT